MTDDPRDTDAPDEPAEAPETEHGGNGKPQRELMGLPPLRPPRRGADRGGGRSRWVAIGCVATLLVLAVVLFTTLGSVERTVWRGWEEAREQLERRLPYGYAGEDRRALLRDLGRFDTMLRTLDEPYPVMGAFRRRLRERLADGRLSIRETAEMHDFVRRALEAEGLPEE